MVEDGKLVEIELYVEDIFVWVLVMELISKILSIWFIIKNKNGVFICINWFMIYVYKIKKMFSFNNIFIVYMYI